MKKQKTAALVLRRWPYSESSQIIRLLTPNHGSLPILAKGVNKLKSGKVGVLDTWSLVEAEFGGPDDRELLQLYNVKLLNRYSGISRTADSLAAAALLAEACELASPSGLPSSDVFLFLVDAFNELDEGTEFNWFLCCRIIQVLSLLGLSPRLDSESEIAPETLWFSPSNGGLLPPKSPKPTDSAYRITPDLLTLLRDFRLDPKKAKLAPMPKVAECLTMLGEFLCYHLERPPKAWTVLNKRRKAALQS